MTQYAIFFLNDAGQSYRKLDLDCADDVGAALCADGHAAGRAMELWSGARVVKRYPPGFKKPA